jgi:S-DNA-T family DNA segregation ATPase FtsK/SpoIIIE
VAPAEPRAGSEVADDVPPEPEPQPEVVDAPAFEAEPAGDLAEEPEAAASAEVEEPVVEIPRPEEDAPRQGSLFGLKRGDDPLVAEAIDLIQQSGRASASFLQRKLRVDFGTASQLLLILAERGVIELDADQSQGRLLR